MGLRRAGRGPCGSGPCPGGAPTYPGRVARTATNGSTARGGATQVRTARSRQRVHLRPPPAPRYRVRDSGRGPAPTSAAVPAPPSVALAGDPPARPGTSARCPALTAPARKAARLVFPIQIKTAIQIWRKALRLDGAARRTTNGKGWGRSSRAEAGPRAPRAPAGDGSKPAETKLGPAAANPLGLL